LKEKVERLNKINSSLKRQVDDDIEKSSSVGMPENRKETPSKIDSSKKMPPLPIIDSIDEGDAGLSFQQAYGNLKEEEKKLREIKDNLEDKYKEINSWMQAFKEEKGSLPSDSDKMAIKVSFDQFWSVN
jgi:hypothetical protein